jgi:hypothetical protein
MNMEGHDTGRDKPGRQDLAPETNIACETASAPALTEGVIALIR